MADEEIWDEALRAYWSGPVDRKKNTQNAMARIRELLATQAAPELLEAVKFYLSGCDNRECEYCKKARAAIAKAEGRA